MPTPEERQAAAVKAASAEVFGLPEPAAEQDDRPPLRVVPNGNRMFSRAAEHGGTEAVPEWAEGLPADIIVRIDGTIFGDDYKRMLADFERNRIAELRDEQAADYAAPPVAQPVAEPEAYNGEGVFTLGTQTIIGTEVLCDNVPIDWLTGRPLPENRFPIKDPMIYERYFLFYTEHIKIVRPEPIVLTGTDERLAYLDTIPKPFIIPDDDGTEDGYLVIPPNELTLLIGEKEQGKTWAGLYIAKTIDEPVLYIATEGVASVVKRMNLIGDEHYDNTIIFGGIPDHHDILRLAEQDYSVILWDVLAPMLLEENQASSWNDFIRRTEPLTAGKTNIIIHHQGKNKALGGRGSSAIEAAATNIYRFNRDYDGDETIVRIRRDKDRNGYRPPGLDLHLFTSAKFHIQARPPGTTGTGRLNRDALRNAIVSAYRDALAEAADGKLPSLSGIAKRLAPITGTGRPTAEDDIIRNEDLFVKKPKAAARGGTGYRLAEVPPDDDDDGY